MAVVGLGLDLVRIDRFARAASARGRALRRRLFTASEQADCAGRLRPAQHYAARFAAKEAFLKALGTGYAEGIKWTDIEAAGTAVRVRGRARAICKRRRIRKILLSVTHDDRYAAAVVVLSS